MRAHVIENGVVTNTIEVPALDVLPGLVDASLGGEIGDTWNGSSFTPPPTPAPTVPQVVTMRQARLALLAAGKLAGVTTAIASMPSPQREAAEIEWEYAQEFKRDWPLVLALAPALGLSDADIDALFVLAATL